MRRISFALGAFATLLVTRGAQAQTINATTCNEGDVAHALSLVTQDGTTVAVPPGDCTWKTALTYTQAHSFILQGAGAVSASTTSASGAGMDATILEDDIDRSTGDVPMLAIQTIAGKSFRLTGFAFKYSSANTTASYNGSIDVTGLSTAVRIDHNHIGPLSYVDMVLGGTGCIAGVVDHNQFDSAVPEENHMRFQAGGCNADSSGNGNGVWADDSKFGSNDFVFAELNSFNWVNGTGASAGHGFASDCSRGGRYVLRYNTMWYHILDVIHGTRGDDVRGCRAHEEYGNTLTWSGDPPNDAANAWVQWESGTGLDWGNSFTGYVTLYEADVVRANNATYSETPPPNGWGYCGNTLGPSQWDGNRDSTGYPCLDSVARGKGDLVTGTFPTKCDSTTGCTTYDGTWPNQVLDPAYVWDITYNPPPQWSNEGLWSNSTPPVTLAENRDYYLQLPNYNESATFDGTAGVGQGPLASKPGTCTKGVGWWATDQGNWNSCTGAKQGVLYVCTATNTWTEYYQPYTFPHPLDTAVDGCSSDGGTTIPPGDGGATEDATTADAAAHTEGGAGVDAGAIAADASPPPGDAGSDDGTPPTGAASSGGSSSGCSCRAAAGHGEREDVAIFVVLGGIAGVLLRRRRRAD